MTALPAKASTVGTNDSASEAKCRRDCCVGAFAGTFDVGEHTPTCDDDRNELTIGGKLNTRHLPGDGKHARCTSDQLLPGCLDEHHACPSSTNAPSFRGIVSEVGNVVFVHQAVQTGRRSQVQMYSCRVPSPSLL